MCIPADIESWSRLGMYRLWRKKRQDDLGEIWTVRWETNTPDWWPAAILRRFAPEVLQSEHVLEALRCEVPRAEAFHQYRAVQVIDFSERRAGELVLVSEMVFGSTLEDVVAQLALHGETLPLCLQLHIAKNLAFVLRAAHEGRGLSSSGEARLFVHGLLSSREIFIARECEIKVYGYGLGPASRALWSGPASQGPTARGDMMAFGLVLHEMATGEQLLPPEAPGHWLALDRGHLPAVLKPKKQAQGELGRISRLLLDPEKFINIDATHELIEELLEDAIDDSGGLNYKELFEELTRELAPADILP